MLSMLGTFIGGGVGRLMATAVAALVVGFYIGYDVADDAAEVRRLTEALDGLHAQFERTEVARAVAEARVVRLAEEAETYRDIIASIEEAADEDDDPIGPLLRSVLDRMHAGAPDLGGHPGDPE